MEVYSKIHKQMHIQGTTGFQCFKNTSKSTLRFVETLFCRLFMPSWPLCVSISSMTQLLLPQALLLSPLAWLRLFPATHSHNRSLLDSVTVLLDKLPGCFDDAWNWTKHSLEIMILVAKLIFGETIPELSSNSVAFALSVTSEQLHDTGSLTMLFVCNINKCSSSL